MTRWAATIVALAGAIVIAAGIGWDSALWDARQQALLHLAAVAAIGTLAWLAWRGEPLPRTALDLPLLALLLAYGVATLSAWNIGLSAPALAGILATALMLPLALIAVRRQPTLTALLAVVPVIALGALSVAPLVWRRIEWVLAGGPGLPPVRLANETTPFGLVTVPPFALLAALPIALLVTRPDLRRWLVRSLLVLCVPLTLVSGSRSAWIAFAVAAAVMAVSSIGELRSLLRMSRRRIGTLAAVVVVAGLGLAFVAPRLTATSSLVYRESLWRTTLHVWSSDPLLGIGPGGMAYARQAIAPLVQVHSHDVPLGILGDAGLLGLLCALLLFARFVWVARPRREHPIAGRAAFAVLMGVAVGFLTDDLTFLPNINLLLILLVAVALRDAGAIAWRPLAPRLRGAWAAGAAVTAVALLSVACLADASAIWYRAGADAWAAGRPADATQAFEMAVRLDPEHPAGPKALTVAADRVGDLDLARRSAAQAVALNPGDWASWTNLSLLCLRNGEPSCAAEAARRAVVTSGRTGVALLNAAVVLDRAGRPDEADALYAAALLADPQVGLVVHWPRHTTLPDAPGTVTGTFGQQLALLVARHEEGEPLQSGSYGLASIRALAFAMEGRRGAANAALSAAYVDDPADPLTWDVAALLLAHWGEDNSTALRMGDIARRWPLATGPPAIPALSYDIGSLRSYPGDGLIRGAQRLIPDRPWPWDLEPLLAPSPTAAGGG